MSLFPFDEELSYTPKVYQSLAARPWKMDENGWLVSTILSYWVPFVTLLRDFCSSSLSVGDISKWMIFSRGVISKGPLWKAPRGGGCVTVSIFFPGKVGNPRGRKTKMFRAVETEDFGRCMKGCWIFWWLPVVRFYWGVFLSFAELGPPKFKDLFYLFALAGRKTSRTKGKVHIQLTEKHVRCKVKFSTKCGNLFSTFPAFLLETKKKY